VLKLDEAAVAETLGRWASTKSAQPFAQAEPVQGGAGPSFFSGVPRMSHTVLGGSDAGHGQGSRFPFPGHGASVSYGASSSSPFSASMPDPFTRSRDSPSRSFYGSPYATTSSAGARHQPGGPGRASYEGYGPPRASQSPEEGARPLFERAGYPGLPYADPARSRPGAGSATPLGSAKAGPQGTRVGASTKRLSGAGASAVEWALPASAGGRRPSTAEGGKGAPQGERTAPRAGPALAKVHGSTSTGATFFQSSMPYAGSAAPFAGATGAAGREYPPAMRLSRREEEAQTHHRGPGARPGGGKHSDRSQVAALPWLSALSFSIRRVCACVRVCVCACVRVCVRACVRVSV
jgi:hypothetical protein